MLPVWKEEEYCLCANTSPDMEILMLIRIKLYPYFPSRANVWTVSNSILLRKRFVPE